MTISPGVYRIRNVKTNSIFDLSRQTGFKIHSCGQHDGANQHWFVIPSGEGVVLKNFESGQYAYTIKVQNGTQLLGSGNFTIWSLYKEGNEWVISLPETNYIVELQAGNGANGTAIQLWVKSGAAANYQKWFFERINDSQPQQLQMKQLMHQEYLSQQLYSQPVPFLVAPGTYFIRNVMSGTILSACNASTDGGEVTGYGNSSGDHQKWQLQPTGYGQNVTFRNVQTNTYLWFRSQSFVPSFPVRTSFQPQEYVVTAANYGFFTPVTLSACSMDPGMMGRGQQYPIIYRDYLTIYDQIGIWHNDQQENQKWHFDRA